MASRCSSPAHRFSGGVGFAQVEDGRSPAVDGNVVAALASDADSSADAERLRTSATQGARYHRAQRTT